MSTENHHYNEQCANTMLIGQAPSMLEALEEAKALLEEFHFNEADGGSPAIEAALKAIRKPLTALSLGGC